MKTEWNMESKYFELTQIDDGVFAAIANNGTGAVGSKDDLVVLRDYLTKLIDQAAELAAGKTPLETISSIEIPEMYAEWQVSSLYANNLKHLYEQFSKMEARSF